MTVSFFGHRKICGNEEIKRKLKEILQKLIAENGATNFYVGNNGEYDTIVRKTLKELKKDYPQINYAVVLSYLPIENKIKENDDYSDTIFPEELAKVPRRFAIDKRNHWMIERSSVVVTYVKNNIGGAAKFKEIAEKKGLNIINISD